jgi:hypothetical protein
MNADLGYFPKQAHEIQNPPLSRARFERRFARLHNGSITATRRSLLFPTFFGQFAEN